MVVLLLHPFEVAAKAVTESVNAVAIARIALKKFFSLLCIVFSSLNH